MQKSLNFDLDTNKLKELYPNKSYTQAYKDIKKFLLKNGFEHRQGSGYISKEDMSELKVVSIIKDLNKNNSWLEKCCKTLDYYDVGEQYNGLDILKKDYQNTNLEKSNELEIATKNIRELIAAENQTQQLEQ